jgi:replicative DNA helicase
MADKLSTYGHNFQVKVISSLLTDRIFLQQVSDIMSPDYFESQANQWIVETIKTYFVDYGSIPTLDVFKIKTQEESSDILKTSIIDNLREVFKYVESDDLDFVKEESLKFCKNQEIKKAIMDSVDLLKRGQYEDIKKRIDEAMKAGADKDIGYEYLLGVAERYTDNVRNTMPTCWPLINDLAGGGFGKGELIIFVAGPGGGKSTAMMNIGAHILKKGLRVVHYTMELTEAYVSQRYDAVITGIATQNLKYHIEDIETELKKISGELIVKYYPTKTASVSSLKAHMDKLILQGKKPDIVIVDYADLLRGSGKAGRDALHQELENIYEDLRGLAGEYEVPVFTASQANRSSAESDIITGEQVASSFAKIMIGDFVISLSRKVTDKIAGTGRWYVIKNRFGPDGLTLPSRLNMSNGRIDIFEETSVQGKETKKTMENGDEILRKSLATKFKEINGGSLG